MKNSIYSILITGIILLVGCQAKNGDPGPAGSNGVNGQQGPRGEQGPQGTQGPAGTTGTQGPQGNPGTNGTNGTNGTDGTNGTNGTNGNANVKVFYFTVAGTDWAAVSPTATDTTAWSGILNNAAFTQGAKDSAMVLVYKKGSDNVNSALPINDGLLQESFSLPSANTNINLLAKKQDNSNLARPANASYRVVIAYPTFVRQNPNLNWGSERAVLAAIALQK